MDPLRPRSARLWPRAATALALLALACSWVPYTQRSQVNVVPAKILRDLGRTSYDTALQDVTVIAHGEDVERLERVGERIVSSAPQTQALRWRFAMLAGDQANAWALPGGYITFYTGILPALQNEAGMAFVMGHEVGHTVAAHAGERLTQQLALLGGITVLDLYMTQRSSLSQPQRQLLLAALGLGAEVGLLLPYSRLHEHEADVVGLMYMAQAGYPPSESLQVWERMATMAKVRPPAFLSTHPSPVDRQHNLREWMPQAERRYRRNALPFDTTRTLWTASPVTSRPENPEPSPPGAPSHH